MLLLVNLVSIRTNISSIHLIPEETLCLLLLLVSRLELHFVSLANSLDVMHHS